MADDTGQLGVDAGQGALSGASLGPLGAVAGGALGLAGGLMGAAGAKSAGRAQQAAALNWSQYVAGQEQSALSNIGTPAQMAAHDQALQAQERQVQRQEELAKTINPALIEQGKQYAALLQGKSAPALSNLQNQRAIQRQQLVGQLQQQLGPGAETSTAGMQALNQFDQETSNQTSQAQQQYTGLLGQLTESAPGSMNATGAANTQLSSINAQDPSIQRAQVMAQFTGAGAAPAAAGVNAAGAGGLAQALLGQTLGQLGNNVMKFGASNSGDDKNKKLQPGQSTPGSTPGDVQGGINTVNGLGQPQDNGYFTPIN